MLNPTLFNLLERRFGKGQVRVTSEDRPMQYTYKIDPLSDMNNIRYSLEKEDAGEEYYVKCPFCQDWKERLYVNHRWGIYDEKTRSRNLWLACCFNEQCLSNSGNQRLLYEQVVESVAMGPALGLKRPERRSADQPLAPKRAIDLPGPMWPLDDMRTRSPKHPALQFAEDRLWDPVYLGKKYEVGYCVDSYLEQAKNRIVAPIFLHSKLVGWQARYLGTPPKGEVKWYTCPGMKAASVLYNYDEMKNHQTKVICEGPSDVWAFGPQSCAVFKKTLSTVQIELLSASMRSGDTVVILLDPDDVDEAVSGGQGRHHIEIAYETLNRLKPFTERVVKVYLPGGKDPDELDREYMRGLIRYEAAKVGLEVSFGKPRKEVINATTEVRDMAPERPRNAAGRSRLRRRGAASRG